MELRGERFELKRGKEGYPKVFEEIRRPPETIFGIGDPGILAESLAIVGARKATPYGKGCAYRFASLAAQAGVTVVSGGAFGCDASAHEGVLDAGGKTIAVLGGGCDELYPARHFNLFQRVIDGGGAVISEYPWHQPPLPFQFRERNRIIAGMSLATLIVEAGLPSGTFSTADEALGVGREVMAVPGAITSASSQGSNRLICQGAVPIIDDESFTDALCVLFGTLRFPKDGQGGAPKGEEVSKGPSRQGGRGKASDVCDTGKVLDASCAHGEKEGGRLLENPLVCALLSQAMGVEECYALACRIRGEDARAWMTESLLSAETEGLIMRYPDGRYGPSIR